MFTRTKSASRSRRLALVSAAILAVAIGIGVAAPANAYQNTSWSGRQGSISVQGPARAIGNAYVVAPQLVVNRNGYVPIGTPQYVTVRQQFEFYTTSGWRAADSLTQNLVINVTSQYAWAASVNLRPKAEYGFNGGAGYYRVTYFVTWGGPWTVVGNIVTSGTQVFVPTLAGGMECAVSNCRAHAGSLQLW